MNIMASLFHRPASAPSVFSYAGPHVDTLFNQLNNIAERINQHVIDPSAALSEFCDSVAAFHDLDLGPQLAQACVDRADYRSLLDPLDRFLAHVDQVDRDPSTIEQPMQFMTEHLGPMIGLLAQLRQPLKNRRFDA